MSNYDPNASAPGFSANGATAIDVGLRAFMLRVYNYMAAGVGLTGVAAFLTYQFTGPELLQSPLMWVFMLAPLGLVFFISARINTLSVEAARGLFFLYAALSGFHCRPSSTSTRSPRSRGCSLSRRRPSARSASGVTLPSETYRDSELSCSWA
jgi:FtsH-binding integral membrane protein